MRRLLFPMFILCMVVAGCGTESPANAAVLVTSPSGSTTTATTVPAAVTAAGSNKRTIEYTTDQTLTANLTVPATLELVPVNGAKINHGAYTITYAGSTARWPDAQVLSGTGAVTLSGTKRVLASWGGPTGLQKMALASGGKELVIDGTYDTTTTITPPAKTKITGKGTINAKMTGGNVLSLATESTVQDIKIQAVAGYTGNVALLLNGGTSDGLGGEGGGGPSTNLNSGSVQNVTIQGITPGVEFTHGIRMRGGVYNQRISKNHIFSVGKGITAEDFDGAYIGWAPNLCYIYENDIVDTANGVYGDGPTSLTVSNNNIYRTSSHSMHLKRVINSKFEHNWLEQAGTNLYFLDASSNNIFTGGMAGAGAGSQTPQILPAYAVNLTNFSVRNILNDVVFYGNVSGDVKAGATSGDTVIRGWNSEKTLALSLLIDPAVNATVTAGRATGGLVRVAQPKTGAVHGLSLLDNTGTKEALIYSNGTNVFMTPPAGGNVQIGVAGVSPIFSASSHFYLGTPVAASGVPADSIFRDVTDNIIKIKDNGGVVRLLY